MTLGTAIVTVDIHGMDKRSAKIYIDKKLSEAPLGVYRLRIIHGFHGGTALRDGIRGRYGANGKVKRVELGLNPGQTDLVLREF